MKSKKVPKEPTGFDWIDESRRLERMYPSISSPIRCENGCGAVIAMADAYVSYIRDQHGKTKLICACCAAEIGHKYEDMDDHDESPVCKRKPKKHKRKPKKHKPKEA